LSGETVSIEVLARRLNSPLDARLVLLDPEEHILAVSDDAVDRSAGTYSVHCWLSSLLGDQRDREQPPCGDGHRGKIRCRSVGGTGSTRPTDIAFPGELATAKWS